MGWLKRPSFLIVLREISMRVKTRVISVEMSKPDVVMLAMQKRPMIKIISIDKKRKLKGLVKMLVYFKLNSFRA